MSLKKCSECGNDVSSSAKKCPHCGKDLPNLEETIKGFLYLAVFIWLGWSIFGETNENMSILSEPKQMIMTPDENIVYENVSIEDLTNLLDKNAARATQTYEGKYIEFIGDIYVIDARGEYFTVVAKQHQLFMPDSIHCSIEQNKHKQFIINKNVGDSIRVKGKVRRVGEIMGYRVDVMELSDI